MAVPGRGSGRIAAASMAQILFFDAHRRDKERQRAGPTGLPPRRPCCSDRELWTRDYREPDNILYAVLKIKEILDYHLYYDDVWPYLLLSFMGASKIMALAARVVSASCTTMELLKPWPLKLAVDQIIGGKPLSVFGWTPDLAVISTSVKLAAVVGLLVGVHFLVGFVQLMEFEKMLDLPKKTTATLELALGGGRPPRELLLEKGWTLVDGFAMSWPSASFWPAGRAPPTIWARARAIPCAK